MFLILALVVQLGEEAARAQDDPECVRRFSSLLGYERKIWPQGLAATAEKVWSIFEDDLTARLARLSPQVREEVEGTLARVRWSPDLPIAGEVMPNTTHTGVWDFRVRETMKGKILSTVTLRHEIEHIIDLIERGQTPNLTALADFLHPRTLTARMERRAFKSGYDLARKIALQTDPAILRQALVAESGLPPHLHRDFEMILRGILPGPDGRWTHPEKARLLQGGLASALKDGAAGFTADQIRAATRRLRRYLNEVLAHESYQQKMAAESDAKAALLVVYSVLGASGSVAAYVFFSALFNDELDEAGAPQRPPLPSR